MTSATKHLLSAFALVGTLGFTACIDQYGERENTQSPYRTAGNTSQEQFVGSIYFATSSSTLTKATLHDLADGATGVTGRRVWVLHLEVVVVFLLLKAQDLSLQGMQHGGWSIHSIDP